jgi:hypothetical protein
VYRACLTTLQNPFSNIEIAGVCIFLTNRDVQSLTKPAKRLTADIRAVRYPPVP